MQRRGMVTGTCGQVFTQSEATKHDLKCSTFMMPLVRERDESPHTSKFSKKELKAQKGHMTICVTWTSSVELHGRVTPVGSTVQESPVSRKEVKVRFSTGLSLIHRSACKLNTNCKTIIHTRRGTPILKQDIIPSHR